jgi:hypothetical protein
MTDLLDAVKDELGGEPSAARAMKILDQARELGWTENPYCSLVIRLARPGDELALPFFARWDLSVHPETGKKSWRFAGARAANGQPLAYNDIKTYLEDPSVIYPEPPSDPEDDTDEAVAEALEALSPLTGPEPSIIPGADWSILL